MFIEGNTKNVYLQCTHSLITSWPSTMYNFDWL